MSSARYLGAVDPHANDDFEEVYELLSKAKRRYRSVRATVVHTVDLTLAKEANRRFIDWRFDQGEPGMGIIGKPGPPQREDFYRAYEHDSKERVCLWHQMPHLWREEIYDLEGRLKEAEVHGGKNGPRWTFERHSPERKDRAVYMPRIPERQETDTRFSFMFDPSEYYFSETFWDGTIVNKTDRVATVAGRECVEVRAETVSWGYPPDVINAYNASVEGATDHLLLVDAEVGTILRVAARLEGREFRVAEVTEIAYDEEFPEGTFRLELPGVQFELMEL
jgi:hypothetical protein